MVTKFVTVFFALTSFSNAFAAVEWKFVEPQSCKFSTESSQGPGAPPLNAAIELLPTDENGKAGFDISLIVSLGDELLSIETFRSVDSDWDGHAAGLITAPGLSLVYNNTFGIINNPMFIAKTRFVGTSSSKSFIVWKNGTCIGSSRVPH